ncbi:hypothetical protein [Microbulbifer sp. A4B17]|nr:hypothetical protein [Microbulbifer sp. A4B17]
MILQDTLRELVDNAGFITAIGAGTTAGWLTDNWFGLAAVLIAEAGLMVN